MRPDAARRASYMRGWLAKNRERVNARRRELRNANPERFRAAKRRSYARHHSAEVARVAAWVAQNPEKRRQASNATRRRRRARLAGLTEHFTRSEWLSKLELVGGVCIYCGEAKPLGPDHKVPLCRGGRDTIDNVVPCCINCNSRKGGRTAKEYLAIA